MGKNEAEGTERDMESGLDEVRGRLTEKLAFEQRPEGGEGVPCGCQGEGHCRQVSSPGGRACLNLRHRKYSGVTREDGGGQEWE